MKINTQETSVFENSINNFTVNCIIITEARDGIIMEDWL